MKEILINPNGLRFFPDETAEERLRLWSQVRMNQLDPSKRTYLTFLGTLALALPDGFRMIIYPDAHAPAINWRVVSAILRFQKSWAPHAVVHVGDAIDNKKRSAWVGSPLVKSGGAEEERESCSRYLRLTMETGQPFWTALILGNHEDRERRHMERNDAVLATMVDARTREQLTGLVNFLKFGEDDHITFITGVGGTGGYDGGIVINDDFGLEHGELIKPIAGQSAQSHAEKWLFSKGIGHIHSAGSCARKMGDGVLRGAEFGYVADENHPLLDYAHNRHDWHHAFGILTVFNGVAHVEVKPVHAIADEHGQLHYYVEHRGILFRSNDR